MVNTRSTDGGLLTNPVRLETQVANMTTNVNQITQLLQEIQARLNNVECTSQRRETGGQTSQNRGHNGGAYGRLTKVEFLKFDGEEVVSWLYRVNNFFEMDHIVENEQKIRLVFKYIKTLSEELLIKVDYKDAYAGTKPQEASNSVTRGRPTSVQTVSKNVVSTPYNRGGGSVTKNVVTMPVQTNTAMPNRTLGGEGMVMKEDDDLQLNKEGVMSTYITRLMNHP
ncbi:hypothetical protein Tco_1416407 [Tanacetum coccineum]